MRNPGTVLIVPTLACLVLGACGGSGREVKPAPVHEPVRSLEAPTPMEQLANLDRTHSHTTNVPENEAVRAEVARRSGFEGAMVVKYPEGGVEIEAAYDGGVKHGEWKKYHGNGQIFEQGEYIGGEKNGMWTTYYASGSKLDEGAYENGEAIGMHRAWLEDGTMIVEKDKSRGRR